MPVDVLKVTKRFMREPIRILVKKEELTLEGIKQFYIYVEKEVSVEKWKWCTPWATRTYWHKNLPNFAGHIFIKPISHACRRHDSNNNKNIGGERFLWTCIQIPGNLGSLIQVLSKDWFKIDNSTDTGFLSGKGLLTSQSENNIIGSDFWTNIG